MKPLILVAVVLIAFSPLVWCQDQSQNQNQEQEGDQGPAVTGFFEFHSLDSFSPEDFEYTPGPANLGQFQRNLVVALQQQFPRLPGMFSSVHSFRLPDYGPLVIISLQPPTIYFTRPVLQQLEEHSRMAEEQAKMVREQIDRAAQMIRLKAREADLLQEINMVEGSKKNKKEAEELQKNLDDIRKGLASLENPQAPSEPITINLGPSDVDLDRMISQNYQQMVDRLTVVLRNTIAETAPDLEDVKDGEKVCVNAHIRRGLSGGQDQSILFVLTSSDIAAFRKGLLDTDALKKKIIITTDVEK